MLRFPDGFVEGRILVAGDPGEPPPECDVTNSVRRVDELFRAISSGDRDLVSRFFPVENPETFGWYSMSGPGDAQVDVLDLDALRDHWEGRFGEGERLELRGIQINRWDHGLAHFGPLLAARWANDLTPGVHIVTGKTAVDCETGKVVVLGLSTDHDPLPFPASDGSVPSATSGH